MTAPVGSGGDTREAPAASRTRDFGSLPLGRAAVKTSPAVPAESRSNRRLAVAPGGGSVTGRQPLKQPSGPTPSARPQLARWRRLLAGVLVDRGGHAAVADDAVVVVEGNVDLP